MLKGCGGSVKQKPVDSLSRQQLQSLGLQVLALQQQSGTEASVRKLGATQVLQSMSRTQHQDGHNLNTAHAYKCAGIPNHWPRAANKTGSFPIHVGSLSTAVHGMTH